MSRHVNSVGTTDDDDSARILAAVDAMASAVLPLTARRPMPSRPSSSNIYQNSTSLPNIHQSTTYHNVNNVTTANSSHLVSKQQSVTGSGTMTVSQSFVEAANIKGSVVGSHLQPHFNWGSSRVHPTVPTEEDRMALYESLR